MSNLCAIAARLGYGKSTVSFTIRAVEFGLPAIETFERLETYFYLKVKIEFKQACYISTFFSCSQDKK